MTTGCEGFLCRIILGGWCPWWPTMQLPRPRAASPNIEGQALAKCCIAENWPDRAMWHVAQPGHGFSRRCQPGCITTDCGWWSGYSPRCQEVWTGWFQALKLSHTRHKVLTKKMIVKHLVQWVPDPAVWWASWAEGAGQRPWWAADREPRCIVHCGCQCWRWQSLRWVFSQARVLQFQHAVCRDHERCIVGRVVHPLQGCLQL